MQKNEEQAAYLKRLDEALIAWSNGDDSLIKKLVEDYQLTIFTPPSHLSEEEAKEVQQGALNKVITARETLPIEIRKKAKKWLVDRSYMSYDFDNKIEL